MQLQSTQLSGFLGVLILSAGLASPISRASEPTDSSQAKESTSASKGVESGTSEGRADPVSEGEKTQKLDDKDDMIEVRISMPDGRVIIRRERKRSLSARRSFPSRRSVSHVLKDGSRISYGRAGVSGGSNGSSMSRGRSGGGGGGGGSSSGGGGGGRSAGSGGSGGGGSASGGGGASSGGGVTGDASRLGGERAGSLMGESDQAESTSQASTATGTTLFTGGGVYSFSGSSSSDSSGSNSTDDAGSSDESASTRSSSSSTSSSASTGQTVSTIGTPQYSGDGAVGGQRVEFHGAGMGASVIGNTIYFVGVELVQADQRFDIINGTRIGADSVFMQDGRLQGSSEPLSSVNTGESAIVLDFDSGTVVDLVMLSLPADPSNPIREERTWSVRIR